MAPVLAASVTELSATVSPVAAVTAPSTAMSPVCDSIEMPPSVVLAVTTCSPSVSVIWMSPVPVTEAEMFVTCVKRLIPVAAETVAVEASMTLAGPEAVKAPVVADRITFPAATNWSAMSIEFPVTESDPTLNAEPAPTVTAPALRTTTLPDTSPASVTAPASAPPPASRVRFEMFVGQIGRKASYSSVLSVANAIEAAGSPWTSKLSPSSTTFCTKTVVTPENDCVVWPEMSSFHVAERVSVAVPPCIAKRTVSPASAPSPVNVSTPVAASKSAEYASSRLDSSVSNRR